MFPIQQFITPVAEPRAQNYSAVGDLGEFLAKLSSEEKDSQEKQRQFNANMGQRQFEEYAKNYNEGVRNAQNQQHIEGTNRYYDMQAETHRMGIDDAKEARKDKRLAMLRDALRKAKTMAEKHNILQQMAEETGGTVEEVPREDDSATIPQIGSDAAPAAPPPPKGKKGGASGIPPWLTSYMSSPEVAAASTAPAPAAEASSNVQEPVPFQGVGPNGEDGRWAYERDSGYHFVPAGGAKTPAAKAPSDAVSPFPWAQFGIQPPAPSPDQLRQANTPGGPAAPGAKGTGRFVLKDKSGNITDIFDESQESKARQDRILAIMRPYIKDPENPQSAAAAQRAAAAGAELTNVMGEDKAAEAALKQYNNEMGGFKKQALPGKGVTGGGGGGGLPSKATLAYNKAAEDAYQKVVDKEWGHEKGQTLASGMQAIDAAEAALNAGGGMNQMLAEVALVKAANGRAAAQQEFTAVRNAAGKAAEIETLIRKYSTPDGHIADEAVRQIRQHLAEMRKAYGEERKRIADTTADQVRQMKIFKDDKEKQDYMDRARSNILGPRQGGAPAPATPAPADHAAALDDLEKALKLK